MKLSVLALDDEPWQVTWIEDLVSKHSGTFQVASTFEEAKRLYNVMKPNVITVDIRIGSEADPVKGATLIAAEPDWIGLRFMRFVRVEMADSRTTLFAYTGVDREKLQRIVEDAYQASFFSKFESWDFAKALENEFRKIANEKTQPKKGSSHRGKPSSTTKTKRSLRPTKRR